MNALASELYGVFMGYPAVVVGGGPSAPRLWAELAPIHRQMLVISANGHAARLGLTPDLIVCKDHTHTETKELMEPGLRKLGRPIASRHYWADFRLPKWPIQGNSGQMAIGVAALMGCAPIFPIGFDCYQNGTYFHDPDAQNVSRGLKDTMWRSRYMRMKAKLLPADVRLLEPSLLSVAFPLHTPGVPGRPGIPPVFEVYRDMRTYYGRAVQPFAMRQDRTSTVPVGTVFAMDGEEFAFHLRSRHVEQIDSAPEAVVKLCANSNCAEGSTPAS